MKKKVRWHTSIGKIEIEGQNYLHRKKRSVNKKTLDPLRESIGIINRSYSKRCQKLMTDFGIEESFETAVARMKEHHGVELNDSAVRNITEFHATRAKELVASFSFAKQASKQMVMELDGEMVPLIEYEEAIDRRKKKKNFWAELRIGVAQNYGESSWKYATSFKNPDHLGDRMQSVMKRMGLDENTNVHGVRDGASWIVEQGERVAGSNYSHLIDLFHLCEYLAEAVTHHDYRGENIGPDCAQMAIEDMVSQGVNRIYVIRHEENAASARLMEKTGFEVVDTFYDPVRRQTGTRRTTVCRLVKR